MAGAVVLTGYATYQAWQCAQRSCLVQPVQQIINTFSPPAVPLPSVSAGNVPPPSGPYTPPLIPQLHPGVVSSGGFTYGQVCEVPGGFDWLDPAAQPVPISPPWEGATVNGPVVFAANPNTLINNPYDKMYRRATGSTATLVREYPGPEIGRIPFDGFDGNIHDRGHLLAKRFGGSGARNNLVPMWRRVNQTVIDAYEQQVAEALQKGDTVKYSVWPIYNEGNTSQWPDSIRIQAVGKYINFDVDIPNVP